MALVSAREAVFAAIAARLAALLPEPVERNRDDQIAPDQCPRLVLFDGDQQRLPDDGQGYGVLAYEISAQLAGYVALPTLAATMTAVNDLHARAVAALVTNSTTLGSPPQPIVTGGAEIWIEELGLRVDRTTVAQSDAPFAAFVCDLSITLRLPEGAPFLDV